ncbi:class I SAM-dependent RNA methyltransferase [Candidatus Saccharibacteria bacterium]|nr:class I SAM-dependent RNA methyltransferase [Candidatus Saccharibacteria bacterium]
MEITNVELDKIVGGGQVIGTLDNGQKVFVWGGLPGETVNIRITKKKSKLIEGIVTDVLSPSPDRIEPIDHDSYLSTSPWQIMNFQFEQQQKAELINLAFELHNIKLPNSPAVSTDGNQYSYRNKLEFSWYSETGPTSGLDNLDLAFYKRGSRGKIIVDGSSLANYAINLLATQIRDVLRTKIVSARQLKTLLIRCDQQGNCVWQLYVKEKNVNFIDDSEAQLFDAKGGEIIYSNPKSPASVITERLKQFGEKTLSDKILGVPFNYPAESFFQINLPVYEQALVDMSSWINKDLPLIDFYSGVGTIGLTIGQSETTLIEVNKSAVAEMKQNIIRLGKNATPILAPSELSTDYISSNHQIIVDPPRAGLHQNVIAKLLEQLPPRIIYLSCNPVTQARDVSLLIDDYKIIHHKGYNFFPRTPHIEHLVVLDRVTG